MKRLSYVSVVLMLPAVLLSGCGGGSSTVSVAPPAVGRQTHTVNLTGELDVSSPPLTQRITVYDAHFNPHSLVINLTSPIHNPAPGAGVPTNATQQWDVQITLEGMVQPTEALCRPERFGREYLPIRRHFKSCQLSGFHANTERPRKQRSTGIPSVSELLRSESQFQRDFFRRWAVYAYGCTDHRCIFQRKPEPGWKRACLQSGNRL